MQMKYEQGFADFNPKALSHLIFYRNTLFQESFSYYALKKLTMSFCVYCYKIMPEFNILNKNK